MLREYQKEALDFALRQKKCIIVLPTGTGKTIIGIYFIKELLKKHPNYKALVLVPTRILVEQTEKMYRNWGLSATKIYGIYRKEQRKELWKNAKIAIATPETVYYDLEFVKDFKIVVADECHHAVGDDAYAKVLRNIDFEYALGLTAFVPKKRRKELEELIGIIKEYPATHPLVSKYVPSWIGDIFEAPFNKEEQEIYDKIDERRKKARGTEKLVYTLALKYFSSDGALALKETLSRKTRLSEKLEDLKERIFKLRDLHKLPTLFNILNIYDGFEKAIIFVDRIIIANKLYEILSKEYSTTLIIGKLREKMKKKLEEAKMSKIIISTSAGEEGIDLPEADLLIIWSHTSNPLRFIQRHGRIMRPSKPLKFATYIITPNTIDTDLFLLGLEHVKKYVDIGISEVTLKEIWVKSRISKILDVLTEPLPEEWIKEITGATLREIREALRKGLETGEIVYFYTYLGKIYIKKEFINSVEEKFPKDFNPKWKGKVKLGKRKFIFGNFNLLFNILKKYLPLEKLEIIIVKEKGEIVEYDWKKYNYRIDSEDLLKLVLKNALS